MYRRRTRILTVVSTFVLAACSSVQEGPAGQVDQLREAALRGSAGNQVARLSQQARAPEAGSALRAELHGALREEDSPEVVREMITVLSSAYRLAALPGDDYAETLVILLHKDDHAIQTYALLGVEFAPQSVNAQVATTVAEGLMDSSWEDWGSRLRWLRALRATGDAGRAALVDALATSDLTGTRREWYEDALDGWPN